MATADFDNEYDDTPEENLLDQIDEINAQHDPDSSIENNDEVETPPFVPDQKEIKLRIPRNAKTGNIRDASEPAIKDSASILTLLRENPQTVYDFLDHNKELFKAFADNKVDDTSDGVKWTAAILEGLAHSIVEDSPIGATAREGSEWSSEIPYGEKIIRPGRPVFNTNGRKMTDDETLVFLTRKANIGTPYDTFLPHSGIWVKLRAPTGTEVAALQARLAQLKIRLGAESKGMLFSNMAAVLLNMVSSLALACVIQSNYKFNTPTDLEHVISVADEPFLHHALAATMYPDGFNYSYPCIADANTCNHIETAKLNMSTLVQYDLLAFSEEQKKYIARKFNACTESDLKTYKEGFRIETQVTEMFGDVGVVLEMCTIADRRESGDSWINSIIDMTQGSFNEPVDGPQRSQYIARLQKISIARQFSHFVKEIKVREDDDGESSEDNIRTATTNRETIEKFLTNILSTPEYNDRFINAVSNFIDSQLIGMIAITSWNCPVCESPAATKFKERFPHLIPIDMLSTFFTLAASKSNRMV